MRFGLRARGFGAILTAKMMRRLLHMLPAFTFMAIVTMMASCGGDDPPPADIHPLAIKPLPLAPLVKRVDTSRQDRQLALLIAYAKKKYPNGLNFDKMETFDHETQNLHLSSHTVFDYEVTPKYEIFVMVAKPKQSRPDELSGQDFLPGITGRRFALYAHDRITEGDPIRIVSHHH